MVSPFGPAFVPSPPNSTGQGFWLSFPATNLYPCAGKLPIGAASRSALVFLAWNVSFGYFLHPGCAVLKVGAVPSSPIGPFILVLQPRARHPWHISLSVGAQGNQIYLYGSNSECPAKRFAVPSLPIQAQSDAEALAGALDKDEGRASPCTPSTPSVCSPPSAASSVPSAGKNICSSCGLEILDRYLLKVSQGRCCLHVHGCGLQLQGL